MMQPDDVRAYLAKRCAPSDDMAIPTLWEGVVPGEPPAAGISSLPAGGGVSPPPAGAGTSRLEDSLFKTISDSYFFQRIGLAALSFLLPVFLVAWGFPALQGSMSAYYHYVDPVQTLYGGGGTRRNVLVGVLCAVGCFLNLYKGYSRREDIALNIAGITAIGVAMFPMDWPSACAPGQPFLQCASPIWMVHAASAILFFLMIAYVCVFRSQDTLDLTTDLARRHRYRTIYVILGTLMVAVPATLLLMNWLVGLGQPAAPIADQPPQKRTLAYLVLALEWAGVWIFSLFWIVKSREIFLLERPSA
jgi:hypothetical protein